MSFDAATLSGLGALAYVLTSVVPALDALVPLVPGETVLLAAAVVAGDGGLLLPAVLAAGAAGAFLGDLAAYEVGRRWGGPLLRRVATRERGRDLVTRASRGFDTHGGVVVLASRYVPGGRTASTLTAGWLRFPRRRFVAWSSLAAVMWSAYICVLGLFGGALFGGNLMLGLGAGLGVAVVVGGAAELARRRWTQARSVLPATASEQYVSA